MIALDEEAEESLPPVLDPHERLVLHIVFQAFKDIRMRVHDSDPPRVRERKLACKEDAVDFLLRRLWMPGNRFGELLMRYNIKQGGIAEIMMGAMTLKLGKKGGKK